MNDADFKVHVHKMFKRTGDVDNDTSHALMGLAGESGEVIDLLKKVLHTGKPYDEETRHKLQLEIGDVLFYIYALCDVLNLSIVHILSLNKEKLEARYPNGAASVGIKETK
jgi:NTP pyrophosphatase (non-canonical NTP hydrolase)